MSAGTIAIAVMGVLLALALLFIVALLRSHAEILRRLDALETGSGRGAAAPAAEAGGEARDIVGETLAGDSVKLALGPGSPRTLLAFMSSGCAACESLWADLREGQPVPTDTRLVVVTKGPDRERLSRLLELAPSNREVVMSSAAWEDFAVPSTPHFVLVDGDHGAILGRGGAVSWQQLDGLLRDAQADSDLYRARNGSGPRTTRTTSERAARAEEALTAAGITPGHPSLHPSRQEEDGPR